MSIYNAQCWACKRLTKHGAASRHAFADWLTAQGWRVVRNSAWEHIMVCPRCAPKGGEE